MVKTALVLVASLELLFFLVVAARKRRSILPRRAVAAAGAGEAESGGGDRGLDEVSPLLWGVESPDLDANIEFKPPLGKNEWCGRRNPLLPVVDVSPGNELELICRSRRGKSLVLGLADPGSACVDRGGEYAKLGRRLNPDGDGKRREVAEGVAE